MKFTERRAIQRFAMGLRVTVSDLEAGINYPATTRDISAHGAYLIAALNLPAGTPVRIAVEISTTDPFGSPGRNRSLVNLAGWVLRREHVGMAVQFTQKYKIHAHTALNSKISRNT